MGDVCSSGHALELVRPVLCDLVADCPRGVHEHALELVGPALLASQHSIKVVL